MLSLPVYPDVSQLCGKGKKPRNKQTKISKKSDLVNYGIYISSIYLKEVSLRSRLCKSHESLQSLQSLQSHAPVFFFYSSHCGSGFRDECAWVQIQGLILIMTLLTPQFPHLKMKLFKNHPMNNFMRIRWNNTDQRLAEVRYTISTR